MKRNTGQFSARAVREWMKEHAQEGKTYAQLYVEMDATELEDRGRIRDAVRYLLRVGFVVRAAADGAFTVTGKDMPRRAAMMTPEQARVREAELRRARHIAAGGMSREQYLEKLASGQAARRSAPRSRRVQPRLARVGVRAANTPAPKKQLHVPRGETVEQFLARGGQVVLLPGFERVRPVYA